MKLTRSLREALDVAALENDGARRPSYRNTKHLSDSGVSAHHLLDSVAPQTESRLRKSVSDAKASPRVESAGDCQPGAPLERQSAKRIPASGIRSCMAETPTGPLSFFEAGESSDLPALVVLPGFLCSAQCFLKSLLPLAAQTKLLAVEWRGHGKSAPSKDCSIDDLATDVMSLIRTQLSGSKICILGHSMGARVMWAMMDAFKQELSPILEGIASLDQGPAASTGKTSKGPTDQLHASMQRDSKMIASGKTQMLNFLQKAWGEVGSGFLHSKSEIADWMAFAGNCDPTTAARLHWDALTTDYCNVIKSTKVKVLLMVGDATLSPSTVHQRMGQAVPPHGAHFALFNGGTHCLYQQAEQVPKLVSLVDQLLKGSLETNTSQGRPIASPTQQNLQRFSHRRQGSGDSNNSSASSSHSVIHGPWCSLVPVQAAAYGRVSAHASLPFALAHA